MKPRPRLLLAAVLLLVFSGPAMAAEDDTYDMGTILKKAETFFGGTTKGLAEVMQKTFKEHGWPNGYITGEEASGAFVVGLRYGRGKLNRKNGETRDIFWQGPTVGFDIGGNASKVFTLIYHMSKTDELYQRIPGVDGSLYIAAGFGVNYQQTGELILAPIRTGVGLRLGVNVGYLHYGKKQTWIPF
ncbi:MAG TPA: DUF1134 domain-containing protein [Rhodospirillales bacterium]|jgi:hypothetical protein|nr:DUF1134 domain-containing protein [Rhodospirillales bacterium]